MPTTTPDASAHPRADIAYAVILALPGVSLALAGLVHPMRLTWDSSRTWWVLHLLGLFAFPLIGVALMALFRGRRDPVAAVAVLAAFVYATAYSALDVISGIAAGYVTWRLGPDQPRPDEVRYLFDIGSQLGTAGSVALLVAAVVVAADAVRRLGARGLVGLVLPVGAWLVGVHHIFHPWGVAGMGLIGLATGYLAWAARPRTAATGARSSD